MNNEKVVSLDLSTVMSAGYLTREGVYSERFLSAGHFLPLSQEDINVLLDYYCFVETLPSKNSQVIVGLARPRDLSLEDLKISSRLSTPIFNHLHRARSDSSEEAIRPIDSLDLAKQFIAAETMSEAGNIMTQARVAKAWPEFLEST